MKPIPAKEGDMRVYNIINPPNDGTFYPVNNAKHAKKLIAALADSQLLQPWIQSNAFGCEVFEHGEWCEYYDKNGNTL